jgi:hypothetical protein
MVNIGALIGALGSYQTIIEFIDKGSLLQILSTIGDVHLEAANRELRNLKSSADKRAGVNRAATCLQVAMVAYEKQRSKSLTKAALDFDRDLRAANRREMSMIALVACYLYLQEWRLAERVLDEEEARINKPAKSDGLETLDMFGGMLVGFLSPKTYTSLFKTIATGKGVSDDSISYGDMESFKDAARSMIKNSK